MHPKSVNIELHIFKSPQFRSVVIEAINFFNETPLHILPPPFTFVGVGVYALYYRGRFPHYQVIGEINKKTAKQPIYVGKAVPHGWRIGRNLSTQADRSLFSRLCQHGRNIEQVLNLKLSDFSCRFAILADVETDLIPAIEAQLIRDFNPLWNTIVDGFGNHDPGKGRYNQALSEWDVLHPGREWAKRLTGIPPKVENIIANIEKHCAKLPFP